MAIYGIGCGYDGKDMGNKFYSKGLACIGWQPGDKSFLFGIMREVDIGDIVIMKAFFQRAGKQVLRIKGVGVITDNTIRNEGKLGCCLKVKWLKYDAKGLDEVEYGNDKFDAGVQRRTSIYREYNLDICKRVVEMLIAGLS